MLLPSLPFWLPVEEGTGWVDVDHLLVNECPIPFLGILLCCIPEEATTNGLLDPNCCLPTRYHIQLMPARQELERKRLELSTFGCNYQDQFSKFSLAITM